jgi:UTP--glucose-1-phosphate uridylyltransferase
MLPIVDKPLVQYAVEEVSASGIPMVIFVTGRGKTAIENHFDVSAELEQELEGKGKQELLKQIRSIAGLMRFVYVRQQTPRGLGDAILTARDVVDEEPFAVLLSDDVVANPVPCLKQMLAVFERYGRSVIAIQKVPQSCGELRHNSRPACARRGMARAAIPHRRHGGEAHAERSALQSGRHRTIHPYTDNFP